MVDLWVSDWSEYRLQQAVHWIQLRGKNDVSIWELCWSVEECVSELLWGMWVSVTTF